MIIATKEALKIKPTLDYEILANASEMESFQKKIKDIDKNSMIKIYDRGIVSESEEKIIKVSDHINKTGINAVINNLDIKFKDISNLYVEKKGITTTCCGKSLNVKHKNPSHYLCVFSVFLFYMGFKNIKGFIINERDKKNEL